MSNFTTIESVYRHRLDIKTSTNSSSSSKPTRIMPTISLPAGGVKLIPIKALPDQDIEPLASFGAYAVDHWYSEQEIQEMVEFAY